MLLTSVHGDFTRASVTAELKAERDLILLERSDSKLCLY